MELYIKLSIAAICFYSFITFYQIPQLNSSQEFNNPQLLSRVFFQIILLFLNTLASFDNIFFPLCFIFTSFGIWSACFWSDSVMNWEYLFPKLRFNKMVVAWGGIPLIYVLGIVTLSYLCMLITNILVGGPGGLPNYMEVKVDLLNVQEDIPLDQEESDNTNQDQPQSRNKSKTKKKSEPGDRLIENIDAQIGRLPHNELIEIQTPQKSTILEQCIQRLQLASIDTILSIYLLLTYDAIFSKLKLYTYEQAPFLVLGVPVTKLFGVGILQLITFNTYRQLEATLLPKLTYYFRTRKQLNRHLFYLELLPVIMYLIELIFLYQNLVLHKLPLSLMNMTALPIAITCVKLIFRWTSVEEGK